MRLLAVLLLCVVGLSQATSPPDISAAALVHDAYIWQRVWKPTVLSAARRSADRVRAWRVLAVEADRSGGWTSVNVPWADISATSRPVIAVIRIDGRIDDGRVPALLDRAQVLAENIVRSIALSGVEIDYDCPTSKLPLYATFLAELRRRLPPALRLSITALPTWLGSPHLDKLGADLDELVLQVHAVDDPHRGLFDPDRAERWVREFDRRIGRPFRVALPTYDVRVTWRRDGRLASVEGEVPLGSGNGSAGAEGATLAASPEAVLGLLHALERDVPRNLIGIAWFRLPTEADRRAWSLATWRAVLGDSVQRQPIVARLVPTDSAALWSVTLANDGAVDGQVPRQVHLDIRCTMADGANGFRLKTDSDASLVLESRGDGRLNAHDTRVIGWARCAEPRRQLNVVE